MNRLATETSPYLRQHADQPVEWYPWGDDAFDAARARDVPVLVSIGYSACHWCHVMAHESFDDPEVAAAMNAGFVNIKVDREERPDVDAVYMDAVQAMTGRGGWPMTVVLDHERRPFYGGTYFPRAQFLQLLAALGEAWRDRRSAIDEQASALVDAIAREIEPVDDLPDAAAINTTLGTLGRAFDSEWGGFGQAPKFPSTFHLELVMRAYQSSPSDDARRVVTTSLDAMASGGMYDHIGGGFARYSVDREWLVPHFEKMLYDQALLIGLYRRGFTVFGNPVYAEIAAETIEYVLRDLRLPGGGIASAEDADSPDEHGRGVEGLFTTWTPDEVREALAGSDPATVDEVLAWYGITDAGNFEGRSIPNRLHARGQLRRPPAIEAARERLFDVRSRRVRPGLDDKVLTEWNAMFVTALADAAMTLRRPGWKAAAIGVAEFLVEELRGDDGRWHRSWQADGRPPARHHALAADHAALVEAFVTMSELTGQARWIRLAADTADAMLDWFWDPVNGGLYTTPEYGEELIVRQKDLFDNATPSANSSAARGLLRLAALTGEHRYRNHADQILQLAGGIHTTHPTAVSNALLALDLRRRGTIEVVITGDRPDLVGVAQTIWRPDAVLAWGERYDSPLWADRPDGHAYVCRDHVCELPVATPEELYERLTGRALPDDTTLPDLRPVD